MTEMTDTIAHPPLPDPAAYMFPLDLEQFKDGERYADAYSLPVSNPDEGSTVPLYTAQQMRDHCEAVALPLLKACRQAVYALKGREHDGFLRDAIEQATGDQK